MFPFIYIYIFFFLEGGEGFHYFGIRNIRKRALLKTSSLYKYRIKNRVSPNRYLPIVKVFPIDSQYNVNVSFGPGEVPSVNPVRAKEFKALLS